MRQCNVQLPDFVVSLGMPLVLESRMKGNFHGRSGLSLFMWLQSRARVCVACCCAQVFFTVNQRDLDWLVQESLAYDPFRISGLLLSDLGSAAAPAQKTNESFSRNEVEGDCCWSWAAPFLSMCNYTNGCPNLQRNCRQACLAGCSPESTDLHVAQKPDEKREQVERSSEAGNEKEGASSTHCAGDPLGAAVTEWQTGLQRLQQMLVRALTLAARPRDGEKNKGEEHSRAKRAPTNGLKPSVEAAGGDETKEEPGQHVGVAKVRAIGCTELLSGGYASGGNACL